MKKISLAILASTLMLVAESSPIVPPSTPSEAPQVQMQPPMEQMNSAMASQLQQGKGRCQGSNCAQDNKGMQRRHSAFLISKGLPHLGRVVKKHMNDSALALTVDQKTKLEEVGAKTVATISRVAAEVEELEGKIVEDSSIGTPVTQLQASVEKLAALKAEATMAQLRCIEETKAILTKDQIIYILSKRGNRGMRR